MTLFRSAIVAAAFLAFAWLPLPAIATLTFYVSPSGDNNWSGVSPIAHAPDGPFATLERARDAVRALKTRSALPAGGVAIVISGVQVLTRALELEAQDSGTSGSPIVYKSTNGAVISGGRLITNFRPVTHPEPLAQIDPIARAHVLVADLKELGFIDLGNAGAFEKHAELSFNGQVMQVARWPNVGFVRVGTLLGSETLEVRGIRGSKEGIFTYDGDRPARWARESDGWLEGYWFWDWHDARQKIASIDTHRRVISLLPPHDPYGYRSGQWYYAFNLLSELDSPSEYYIDRQRGVLYFWPPATKNEGTGRAVLSVRSELLMLDKVAHVRFEGLTFEAAQGTAIIIKQARDIAISGCVVRNVGGWAIKVNSGNSVHVHGCAIYGTGGGGIFLSGGDRATLTSARNLADNNAIHNFARWVRTYQPALFLSGVGNIAEHNLVANGPNVAIVVAGNDNLVQFNEVHDVCGEALDVGAIYAGRDWSMRGNVVRGNYLHDLAGLDGHSCVGVYLDDQFSGTTVYGNVFRRVATGVKIGGGRDNLVENNLFVDTPESVTVDARGIVGDAQLRQRLVERLDAVPYESPVWRQRYPALVQLLDGHEMEPSGNRISRNIFVAGGSIRFADPQSSRFFVLGANFRASDSDLDSLANGEVRLKPNSPALRLGFDPVPLSTTGPLCSPPCLAN
jgi:hypothetical protein